MVFRGDKQVQRRDSSLKHTGGGDCMATLQKDREEVSGNRGPSGRSSFFRQVLEKASPCSFGLSLSEPQQRAGEKERWGREERSKQKVSPPSLFLYCLATSFFLGRVL